jgi:hypothetical protein
MNAKEDLISVGQDDSELEPRPSLSVSNGTAVTEYECNRLSSTIRVNSADFLKSQEILLFRNSGRCSEKGRLVLWAEDPIDR